MSTVELTAICAVIVTALSGIALPLYLWRRKNRQNDETQEVVSWQGLTAELRQQRDELKKRLDTVERDWKARLVEMEADHKARLRELDADWERQMTAAKQRIQLLETEVAELYRKLYGPPGPR